MKRRLHGLTPRRNLRSRRWMTACRENRLLSSNSWYLLAMVLIYFRRAKLRVEEYRQYFFPSLFLANQFEEDLEFREEIYAWTPGRTLEMKRIQLLHLRDLMLIKMDFRAWVEKETCDLIMAQDPDHWAWKRQREDHHSLAIRWFRRDFSEFSIRGPWTTLPTCSLCNPILDSSKEEEAEDTHHQRDAEEEPGTSAIIISATRPRRRRRRTKKTRWTRPKRRTTRDG
ncbi:speedy protein 1-A-like isoform 1-T3 [Leptodactylus fuscus]|uniref:speedy protein 1-A-like n=1 Tax=Leptodactylus fuscus TaxID=238119 RepID=UPI003F4E8F82